MKFAETSLYNIYIYIYIYIYICVYIYIYNIYIYTYIHTYIRLYNIQVSHRCLEHGRGSGSSKFDGEGGEGQLQMLPKNTCEGVHLKVKLAAISLQACKFTKNEFLHTHF